MPLSNRSPYARGSHSLDNQDRQPARKHDQKPDQDNPTDQSDQSAQMNGTGLVDNLDDDSLNNVNLGNVNH